MDSSIMMLLGRLIVQAITVLRVAYYSAVPLSKSSFAGATPACTTMATRQVSDCIVTKTFHATTRRLSLASLSFHKSMNLSQSRPKSLSLPVHQLTTTRRAPHGCLLIYLLAFTHISTFSPFHILGVNKNSLSRTNLPSLALSITKLLVPVRERAHIRL